MKFYNFNFSDVDWGPDIADDDYELENYFVEFPGYQDVLNGTYRYIIGRKGTGKSAMLQRIKILANNADSNIFCSSISLKNFPINEFRNMGDSKYRDKSKYVSAWKFLMLVEISKLIVMDNSIEDYAIKNELKKFLDINFPNGIGMVETISTIKEHSNKISVFSNWISGDLEDRKSQEYISTVHFKYASDSLEKILYSIKSSSKYYILADDLDEGYNDNDSNLKLIILALLRSNEELARFFNNSRINCFPIVALRSDIFDSLSDNDLNKLDDFILRLNWTVDPNGYQSIKRVIESRIKYSFKCKYPKEPVNIKLLWNNVFNEKSAPNGLWKYIMIHTFDRPRDIIKIMKYCRKANIHIADLGLKNVKAIEPDYSGWLYREFRDEVQSFLPCWKSVLNCLTEISYGKEKIDRLYSVLSKNIEIQSWLTENKATVSSIVQILFNYSVIGCINENGRWIFKYKDPDLELMPSYNYYCIHYGFCDKLRIVNSYRDLALNELSNSGN